MSDADDFNDIFIKDYLDIPGWIARENESNKITIDDMGHDFSPYKKPPFRRAGGEDIDKIRVIGSITCNRCGQKLYSDTGGIRADTNSQGYDTKKCSDYIMEGVLI